MRENYDVIINGGGMVGSVTALLLADAGLSVAVIEAQTQTTYSKKNDRELRVSAISQHNLELFNKLNITDLMQTSRMGYYQHMQIWDNNSTGEIAFDGPGQKPLGAMVENNQIIAAAQQQLGKHANVEVFYATSIESFEQTERKVKVVLNQNDVLQAHLLVGADGARSKIRENLGIKVKQKPYQQHGLVCYLSLENAPVNTALQAFNSGGPVGLLPMNEGLFSMVWSLPEDQVEFWLKTDEGKFVNGLKAHINRDFGEIKLLSERVAFPLNKTYADTVYKNRVVLVGDAAHTIHPLAGQGVNLGFGDAECLLEKLSQINLKHANDLAQILKKYQRVRQAEVHKTAETMHALHHLFTNQSAPAKMLRAFGMNGLNQIKPIKQWLLKQAGS